jgi:hypothetical protein
MFRKSPEFKPQSCQKKKEKKKKIKELYLKRIIFANSLI